MDNLIFKQKKRRIIIVFLMTFSIIVIALSIIGAIIFWLPNISQMGAKIIYYNPAVYSIYGFWWSGVPSLLGVLISFADLCVAVFYFFKLRKQNKEIISSIFSVLFLAALVINFITSKVIFESMIAG